MELLSIAAWIAVQVFIFGTSVWLIAFGIRNWNERPKYSTIFFILGFGGILLVLHNLISVGIL